MAMLPTFADRVRMSTTSTGTGPITVGSAVVGFQSLTAGGVVDGSQVEYLLEQGVDWEIGGGTFTASSNSVSRGFRASSTGSPLNLASGALLSVVPTAQTMRAFAPLDGAALTNATITGATLDNVRIGSNQPGDAQFGNVTVSNSLHTGSLTTNALAALSTATFGSGIYQTRNALGGVVGPVQLNPQFANFFTATVIGAVTWQFVQPPLLLSQTLSVVLDLTNGGAAPQTWDRFITWVAGAPPTLSVSGIDVLSFYQTDVPAIANDGITWSAGGGLSSAATWSSVAYRGGIFVAVATNGNTAAVSTDGINWAAHPLPASANWSSVTAGVVGGALTTLFVAVASGSAIAATSPDGVTWTQQTLPVSAAWSAVQYIQKHQLNAHSLPSTPVFLAIASGGTIAATSPDGVTWTQRTLPASANWCAIADGLAVGAQAGAVAIASDLITAKARDVTGVFSQGTLPATALWTSVAYNNISGVYVAVASGGSLAATSPDGINWTQQTLPATANWSSVTFGRGGFLAIASGSTIAATSSDGITWTQRTLPASAAWIGAAWGDLNSGMLVAIASDGTTAYSVSGPFTGGWRGAVVPKFQAASAAPVMDGTAAIGVSTSYARQDHVHPTDTSRAPVFPARVNLGASSIIDLNAGSYFAKTIAGVTSLSVINTPAAGRAASFTLELTNGGAFTTTWWSGLKWPGGTPPTLSTGGGIDVLQFYQTDPANTVYDGATWFSGTSLPVSTNWVGLVAGVSSGTAVLLAIANNGTTAMGNVGAAWTQGALPASTTNWIGVAFGNGVFFALALTNGSTGSSSGAVSSDGITWTSVALPSAGGNYNSVTFVNGLFIACAGGSVVTSSNGSTWTVINTGSGGALYAATYGNGVFLATGAGTGGATSPDGITWTPRPLPTAGPGSKWSALAFGNGVFVAASNPSGRITTSPDGITWSTFINVSGSGLSSVFVPPPSGSFGVFILVSSSANCLVATDGVNWVPHPMPASQSWNVITVGTAGGPVAVGGISTVTGYTVSTSVIGGWRGFVRGLAMA